MTTVQVPKPLVPYLGRFKRHKRQPAYEVLLLAVSMMATAGRRRGAGRLKGPSRAADGGDEPP